MGRRFHCDYCDKSFPDSLVNRRAHLNGIQHQQARTLHFNNFLGPREQLEQERSKKPCISFQRKGVCDYGITCRYSHMTSEAMRQLEEASKLEVPPISSVVNVGKKIRTLEEIVRKRRQDAAESASGVYRMLVPGGFTVGGLPPSLSFCTCEN